MLNFFLKRLNGTARGSYRALSFDSTKYTSLVLFAFYPYFPYTAELCSVATTVAIFIGSIYYYLSANEKRPEFFNFTIAILLAIAFAYALWPPIDLPEDDIAVYHYWELHPGFMQFHYRHYMNILTFPLLIVLIYPLRYLTLLERFPIAGYTSSLSHTKIIIWYALVEIFINDYWLFFHWTPDDVVRETYGITILPTFLNFQMVLAYIGATGLALAPVIPLFLEAGRIAAAFGEPYPFSRFPLFRITLIFLLFEACYTTFKFYQAHADSDPTTMALLPKDWVELLAYAWIFTFFSLYSLSCIGYFCSIRTTETVAWVLFIFFFFLSFWLMSLVPPFDPILTVQPASATPDRFYFFTGYHLDEVKSFYP